MFPEFNTCTAGFKITQNNYDNVMTRVFIGRIPIVFFISQKKLPASRRGNRQACCRTLKLLKIIFKKVYQLL